MQSAAFCIGGALFIAAYVGCMVFSRDVGCTVLSTAGCTAVRVDGAWDERGPAAWASARSGAGERGHRSPDRRVLSTPARSVGTVRVYSFTRFFCANFYNSPGDAQARLLAQSEETRAQPHPHGEKTFSPPQRGNPLAHHPPNTSSQQVARATMAHDRWRLVGRMSICLARASERASTDCTSA